MLHRVFLLFWGLCTVSCQPDISIQTQIENALEKGPKSQQTPVSEPPRKQETRWGLSLVHDHQDTNIPKWIRYDASQQPFIDKEKLDSWITNFLAESSSLLQLPADQLVALPQKIRLAPGMEVRSFRREINGIPVDKAYLDLVFHISSDHRYSLREVVNRSFSHVPIVADDLPNGMEEELKPYGDILGRKSIFYPTEIDGRMNLIESTRWDIIDANGVLRSITMEHSNQSIVEAYDYRHHAPPKFSLAAEVWKRSPVNQLKSLKHLPLTNITKDGVASTTTLDSGLDFDASGALAITLGSDRYDVITPGGNTPLEVAVTVDPTGKVTPPNALAERGMHVYTSFHEINRFTRRFISPSETTYLDQKIPILFNSTIQDANCNAFYNRQQNPVIVFGNCDQADFVDSLADFSDVSYHEWGHGLDDYTGRTLGIQDQAFSEGIGDMIGSLFMNTSDMSPGFNGNQYNPGRSPKNVAMAPYNGNNPYQEMLIFNGSIWDMHDALVQRYGLIKGSYTSQRLFFRHLLMADSYQESYEIILRLDDDDNNAMTRSPNHCLINQAFANHALATLEPNCQDQVIPPTIPVDQSIYTMFLNPEENQSTLLVSADEGEALAMCIGKLKECESLDPSEIEFEKVIVDDQEKAFFRSKTAVATNEFEYLTFTVFNDGIPTGARTIKVVTK
ncbi:hypothetical protein [Pseudobacteriovorax antillogorgiicola]|uniref:Fungalysin/Thermolysin Propeptide Motif n=1 Tax=Pseudobacteriovorax antillogorgiicola TaxID=1513793 RepID=A0A1Y6BPT1_9BACT|nr:hypothetical protein [Pseudobacteriovorax antillogorgiicola]TCS53722.1 hypothetical protein EDD56_10731 [Pseudobacteriovorax antillogorgiicola]SMF22822.1 hypothetical protein SAMN06296036_107241 [Pseudobacteriovorax antillogorgiicola]